MAKNTNKKRAGRHTTLIALANLIVAELNRCSDVTKISPGIITPGLATLRGKRRIKLMLPQADTGSLLVIIRDVRSMQEIRVFGTCNVIQACLERYAQEHDLLFTIA